VRVRLLTLLPVAVFAAVLAGASPVRAEYFVLSGGQRLHITGYQLLGDKYRLQMSGGFVELPAENVLSIEPEDVFSSAPPVVEPNAPFRELIEGAAARYRVDVDLITSVIAAESNFNPKAVSRRNARGLMQLLPETAARLGVQNIFDPRENIDAGTHYLRDLLLLYKNDLALTLAAYNAGPQRVRRYGQVPPFAETRSYVKRVGSAYAKRKSSVPDGKPSIATRPATANPSIAPSGL
jgi:soluble lytic murein transglycosylase-like protein